MFWHEYSDASPIGLDPAEFVRRLTDSDFTLCPRGYSRVTHRPVEALLRGSVPVIAADEIDLYGIDKVGAGPAESAAETLALGRGACRDKRRVSSLECRPTR